MKRILSSIALCLAIAGTMNAQELANFNFGGRQRPVIWPPASRDLPGDPE